MINEFALSRKELPFDAWKRDVHSQCGEDGIIEVLLDKIGIKSGYFVEFGAWDGKHLSNTAKLAGEGWRGCFIEGNSERYKSLCANYDGTGITTVNAWVRLEGENMLDNILSRAGAPKTIDVLSIDIDGNDYHVWQTLGRHDATLVVIEFNPTIPSSVVFVQDADPALHQGCSLAALTRLAESRGMVLVAATEWNAFFLPKDIAAEFGVATYNAQDVKSPRYEAAIFHGYDGTVILAGHKQLLWHGIPMQEADMQVLPPEKRVFPA